MEGLGPRFTGTSNCLIARRREVEAIGTNAHELPMVYAALAGRGGDDEGLRAAPYQVLDDWRKDYDSNLLIILPDTYSSSTFFDRAPAWLSQWTGVRIDSGDPFVQAEAVIDWWKSHGEDPRQKRIIFSDGLDVSLIEKLHGTFAHRVMLSFGWGTNLTNDFHGLAPDDGLAPFSLVCKAISANGQPTVKMSDNPMKAMGPEAEIERYRRVFNIGAQTPQPVLV